MILRDKAMAMQARMKSVWSSGAVLVGTVMLILGAGLAVPTYAATADDYPSRPVRFISPFSAGGGTDAVARVLAQRMGEVMGKVFVVDNRGGADGVIGTELAARSPADGYTLLVANLGTFSLTPNLRRVPYDPLRDFAPVTQTTASSTVLVVNPSFPVNSVKELVALQR
jgi:tripartite-type tricarboxylate transporter receptor subunit TctC